MTAAYRSRASLLPQPQGSQRSTDLDIPNSSFFLHPHTSTITTTSSHHSHTTTMPELSLLWRKYRHIAPPGTLGVATSSYNSGKCGVKGTQATYCALVFVTSPPPPPAWHSQRFGASDAYAFIPAVVLWGSKALYPGSSGRKNSFHTVVSLPQKTSNPATRRPTGVGHILSTYHTTFNHYSSSIITAVTLRSAHTTHS